MADPSKAFFDTNVLVYAFDAGEPKKQRTAAELIDQHRDPGLVALSTQILQEFYWVTTRKMRQPLTPEKARRETERFAKLEPIGIDADLVLAAIDRSLASRISLWDGLVVECALASGATTLYSEDLKDGWVVDGRLTVVNPFAARG